MIKSIQKQKGDPVLCEVGIHCDKWRLPYDEIIRELAVLSIHDEDAYLKAVRKVADRDFWFFCYYILELPVNNPYLMARCYEVQDNDFNDCLYLWARDHWKSTIITFARTLWNYTRQPERIVFLFSNSLKLAKPHFMLMKRTMEKNTLLKKVYPDIFYMNPEKDSPCWTINEGLFLKQNHRKDPSLGCYGLVDSMPTGGHPNERLIDDLVDLKNIGTEFMIQKVIEAYRYADNFSSGDTTSEVLAGTTYAAGDLYDHIKDMGLHKISVRAAEVDEMGDPKYGGIPVLLTKEVLDKKKITQGNIYHAQMLLTPLAHGTVVFKQGDLMFYDSLPDRVNYYIVADPAGNPNVSTYKKLDYTAMMLLGAGAGRRIYIVDILHDKIGLKEKWECLKEWHIRYDILNCGYEEYATQKDREYFYEKMEEERFYFNITPLKGFDKTKRESISALAEYFAEKKILLPRSLPRMTTDRGVVDMVTDFIESEYKRYPNVAHDDRLDALRRFTNLDIVYPDGEPEEEGSPRRQMDRPSPLDEDNYNDECYWGDL